MSHNDAVKVIAHCPTCNTQASHIQVLLQKPPKYGDSKWEQAKAFLDGFLAGSASPVLASLELLGRHLICATCGVRRLENEGGEFQ